MCSIIPCTHGNLPLSLDDRSGIFGTRGGDFFNMSFEYHVVAIGYYQIYEFHSN
jgi:hypothetical protein